MWRDPIDELIDDLERVVPARQQTQWGKMPPLAELHYWTDRILHSRPITPEELDGTAEPVKGDYEDDPAFQDHIRRWREWLKGGA